MSLVLAAAPARAEPTLDGSTFTVFERPGVTRFPDVAYDADAGVYLVVSGQAGVSARFVSASGVDGLSFDITTDTMAYSPRVSAVGGAFVVCWLVEGAYSVVCRRVARATPPTLGTEHVLTQGTVGHLESAPSLACSRSAAECLVSWVDGPELALRARRIGLDGAPLGNVIDVAVTDGVFEAFPALACAESRSEYFVAFTREPNAEPMAIAGQRLAVSSDALIGTRFELYTSTGLNNYPELAYDPERQRYLAISWLSEANPDVAGRLLAADGTPIGERIAVAATAGFEGGDGIGLGFDAAADLYLAVFQGPETPGAAQQVWAAPVSADGVPAAEFRVTSSAVTNGVYQPRVASDQNGHFLVVTVADYVRVDGQFVSVDVSHAGAGGSAAAGGSGSGGSAGATDAGSSGSRGSTEPRDDGCGCRTTKTSSPPWLLLALLGLGTGTFRRRRGPSSNADRQMDDARGGAAGVELH